MVPGVVVPVVVPVAVPVLVVGGVVVVGRVVVVVVVDAQSTELNFPLRGPTKRRQSSSIRR